MEFLKKYIREIPDFPKPGIRFKDITPLLAHGESFWRTVEEMAKPYLNLGPTHVVCIEARGFIFGSALSHRLGCGFIPVRKPGKLPYRWIQESCMLEYGNETLCMHEDALKSGDRVVLADDVLATGGTMEACVKLVRRAGAEILGVSFLLELDFLNGRGRLQDQNIHSLIRYS